MNTQNIMTSDAEVITYLKRYAHIMSYGPKSLQQVLARTKVEHNCKTYMEVWAVWTKELEAKIARHVYKKDFDMIYYLNDKASDYIESKNAK